MEIRKAEKEEVIPYELLYLADPSEEAVKEYLKRGILYKGYIKEELAGVYVLLPTRPSSVPKEKAINFQSVSCFFVL